MRDGSEDGIKSILVFGFEEFTGMLYALIVSVEEALSNVIIASCIVSEITCCRICGLRHP